MNPWPKPLAWCRMAQKPFRLTRPDITLVPRPAHDLPIEDLDYIWTHERRVLEQFMGPMPSELQTELARFQNRQWHMMDLLARCPGTLDLVRSTPALAYALASNWKFRTKPPAQPMHSACHLAGLSQPQICGWLGFPATRSTVHILRKLVTSEISVETLLDLRNGLRDASVTKLLRHCPVITRRTIAFATSPECRGNFAPRFLTDLYRYESIEGGENAYVNGMVNRAILDDALYYRRYFFLRGRKRFHTMDQIREYVANLDHDLGAQCDPEIIFPPPPVMGTDIIIPLKTGRSLLDEGKEMLNCVAALYEAALDGVAYFYRIMGPTRATLSLVRRGAAWELGELKGPKNSPVPEETDKSVRAWLTGVFG